MSTRLEDVADALIAWREAERDVRRLAEDGHTSRWDSDRVAQAQRRSAEAFTKAVQAAQITVTLEAQ